jgi:5'/3'-nucleotidase SurE
MKESCMRLRDKILAGTVGVGLAFAAGSSVATAGPIHGGDSPTKHAPAVCDRPLNILLTNDDGYAAEGIQAAYKALRAEGHRVTVVAPLAGQSGKGGAIAYEGVLEVSNPVADDPKIHAVDGTPSDAVALGLYSILDKRPDLVVSGINAGSNLSRITNHSGTVAAATTAIDRGVPALAVSAAYRGEFVPDDDWTLAPDFEGAADLVVDVVASLQRRASSCTTLMPRNVGLSVNYPGTPVKGVKRATFAMHDPIPTTYTETADGRYEVGYSLAAMYAAYADQVSRTSVDYELLARGYSTLTPIDGDMSIATTEAARSRFLNPILRDLD